MHVFQKKNLYRLIEWKDDFVDRNSNDYYNTTDPRVSLSLTKNRDSYKMCIADIGLFVTLMFSDRSSVENEIYTKLFSDMLPANLGYLYENLVAQMIAATGRELYYHTWEKKDSTHYYEIDFLVSKGAKISPIEVKSSGIGKHDFLSAFKMKYLKNIGECFILSQKDISREEGIQFLTTFVVE